MEKLTSLEGINPKLIMGITLDNLRLYKSESKGGNTWVIKN